jgi:hypothetical protein
LADGFAGSLSDAGTSVIKQWRQEVITLRTFLARMADVSVAVLFPLAAVARLRIHLAMSLILSMQIRKVMHNKAVEFAPAFGLRWTRVQRAA